MNTKEVMVNNNYIFNILNQLLFVSKFFGLQHYGLL